MKPGKKILFVFFSATLLFAQSLSAQTNISGVVNSYYDVVEIIPSKACVRVGNPAGLSQNDRTLLIQMKGVTINTSSSSSFGDTLSMNNAGNYELGTICYVRGDSVFFVYLLQNQYTIAGKVQLVRVPTYNSATVTDTLKAAPWNSTTGTGGVLAIFVNNDLTLNAPISADSSGFRGGTYKLSNGTCSNTPGATGYDYNANTLTPQNGAFKGEGAADVGAAQTGGRGAPANGGGGGNNHNNGGAGGSNLSTGGDGGGNSSSTGCTLALVGKGGKSLNSYGGIKIFMGGGGGAGHVNNGYLASNGGGHGGGIVFIRALNMVGNSYKISANGQVGGPAASDGASGGGGGGTIIMAVNNYVGSATIEANGGQGGQEDDGLNINKCYGSGGGGGGGVIYFSTSIPALTINTNGGNAGPEINHDVSCHAAVPSGAGSGGTSVAGYSYSASLILTNSYCSELLPIGLNWFTARYLGKHTELAWQVSGPDKFIRYKIERSSGITGWTEIGEITNDAAETIYHFNDPLPPDGDNYYRIRIINNDNSFSFSSIRKIYVAGTNGSIEIYPNPARNRISVKGCSANAKFQLFDMEGRLLAQKMLLASQGSATIDLPALLPGFYTVKIGSYSRKLIVQ